MQNLNISLIQSVLHWQDIDANLAMFEEKIWQIEENTDLILLPEMFNTGFTNETHKLGEVMKLKTFRWLQQQAAQTKAAIAGSYIVKEAGSFYNRLIWMEPDGNYYQYDKRHLFRMANEHHYFAAGEEKIIVTYKGWKICPLICYDLRFPVWSRNVTKDEVANEYDLLIYVANWPSARQTAWNTLLQARAIENLSYVVGLNRTGVDGNKISYNGDSAFIDPKGNYLKKLSDREETVTISLDYQRLADFRKKFPAHLDADDFNIIN